MNGKASDQQSSLIKLLIIVSSLLWCLFTVGTLFSFEPSSVESWTFLLVPPVAIVFKAY